MRRSFSSFWTLALFASLGVASGCDTMAIQHDYDSQADFSRYRTYSWLERRPSAVADPRIDNSLLDSRVRQAVDAELATKGCSKVSESPDFLVGYHMTLDKKMEVAVVNDAYGYGPGPGWRYGYYGAYGPSTVYVSQYDEGTLLVDFVDAGTKKLVWRGSAMDRVDLSSSPERKEERIREAVRRILEGFPPPKN